MNSQDEKGATAIQRFFAGKVVLLTGGTGFIGKVLLEKLLRSCPDIQRIYITLRRKRGRPVEERFVKLIEDSIFIMLKNEQPNFQQKLTVIDCDLQQPNLGISRSDTALLIEQVNIVIHNAANVRFNENLKNAIAMNVEATKNMCCLAQRMQNNLAFVYVSTVFTNCELDMIPEKVIPAPINPESLITIAGLVSEEMLEQMQPILLGGKLNTNILSKSCAENIVFSYRELLPISIVRPAIVSAAAAEPEPGWVDNYNGATGAVAAAITGLMHTMMTDRSVDATLVPVDKVANVIVAAAFAVGSSTWQCSGDNVPVINYVAKTTSCFNWGFFGDALRKYIRHYPSKDLMYFPFITNPQHEWSADLQSTLLHQLPARTVDFVTSLCCRTPTRLRKLYASLDVYQRIIRYFCTHQFNFEHKTEDELWSLLAPEDRRLFDFNLEGLDWNEYMRTYVAGCRKYVVKQDDSSLAKARTRVKILYIFHTLFKLLVFCLFVGLIYYVVAHFWGVPKWDVPQWAQILKWINQMLKSIIQFAKY